MIQNKNLINENKEDVKKKGERKMVKTISKGIKSDLAHSGCGECQTSCQSACKTSCTVANQKCENVKGNERQEGIKMSEKGW